MRTRQGRVATEIYADDWAGFWEKCRQKFQAPRSLAAFLRIRDEDEKLGMIVALAHDWVQQQPQNVGRTQREPKPPRLVRDRTALRQYVVGNPLMPAPRLGPPSTPQERRRRRLARAAFWRAVVQDRPRRRKTRAQRIELAAARFEHLALEIPYGPRVPEAEYEAWLRSVQHPDRQRVHRGIHPAGMTYERALEIAVLARDRRRAGEGEDESAWVDRMLGREIRRQGSEREVAA